MPVQLYNPALTKAHLSNRFALRIVDYFIDRYGPEIVEEMVEEAGLSLAYLRDPQRWISVEFDREFCDAAARHLGGLSDPPAYDHPFWQHWRESSAAMVRDPALGPLRLLLWAMEGPSRFFADIEGLYSKGNRVTRMRLIDHGCEHASIVAEMAEGVRIDRPGACWSRRGFFEAVPTIWGLPPAVVDHGECVHRDPTIRHCRYDIRFSERHELDPGADLDRLRLAVRTVVPQLLEQIEADSLARRQSLLSQRKLAAYLPEQVFQDIMINPEEEVILGGFATEGAVLFADIVGFTGRCLEVDAAEVVRQLNLYFEVMDAVILGHGGIIDKRIGDGLMAVFVSPDDPRDRQALAATAIDCGLAMLAALPRCNAAIVGRGGRPIAVRIGVAAGPLVQGNLGSRTRLEHTVIGETVNLAARLQAAAGADTLLTLPELVAGAPAGAVSRRLRRIAAKGIGELATIELTQLGAKDNSYEAEKV